MSELVELPKATGESAGQTATSRLRALQQHYQIADNGCGVSGLLDEEPSAFSLLMDAVEPLRNAFWRTSLTSTGAVFRGCWFAEGGRAIAYRI
jgi:hypothetical protein